MTLTEILGEIPESYNTEFGTFTWCRRIGSSSEYEEVPMDEAINADCKLVLHFTPKEEYKWIVTGDTYTGYSLELYVANV